MLHGPGPVRMEMVVVKIVEVKVEESNCRERFEGLVQEVGGSGWLA